MYKFETIKKYVKNTGTWKGIIRVVENDEDLPDKVFIDNLSVRRNEIYVYDETYKKVDDKLEGVLIEAKKWIDVLRKNKKQYEALGNIKTTMQYD